MTETQTGPAPDITINVYKGCVLPEDYQPVRTTIWEVWAKENPDDYNATQLELIKDKLLAGKSWVCFVSRLETISAPDYYKRVEPYGIPITSKAKSIT